MKRRRAIYIGKPVNVEIWAEGRQPDYILSFGMTGDYIGDTFIPDDLGCPSVTIRRRDVYLS